MAVKEPKPKKVKADSGLSKEYRTLARKLEISSPVYNLEALRAFLREANILIYDYEEVIKYLAKKATETRFQFVVWVPLRKRDVGKGNGRMPFGQYHGRVENGTIYRHAVPISVLQTVERISDEFPEAGFFVSDYSAVKPDPFLAVGFRGVDILVVDFWAEPGFKPTKIED